MFFISFWRDLKLAARSLARSRGFLAIAVLCLALGIGANSTMFSLVDGFLMRPLPVRDPGGLVYLNTQSSRGPDELSYAEYADYRSRSHSFAELAAMERRGPVLTGAGYAESTLSNVVSENYFTLFGVKPEIGRVFTEADASNSHPVVVMSYNMWQRRFGGDPSIVGRPINLSGSYVVIGVAAKGFRGTELWTDPDFWIPIHAWDPSGQEQGDRRFRSQEVVGRLRPGVSAKSARSELKGIAAQLEQDYPKYNHGYTVVLQTAREYARGKTMMALFLLAIVCLVLLIACANLANLLLARAAGRGHEIGVRFALGGSRGRLVQQLMAESLLIVVVGMTAGLLLTAWLIRALPAVIIPTAFSFFHLDLRLDYRVFVFTLAASLVTVLVFGLAPALWASRPSLIETIKSGSSGGGRRSYGSRSLVVVQVALSVILLGGAGLLVRTFIRGVNLDLGFQRRDLLVADVGNAADTRQEAHEFYRQVVERVAAIPGGGPTTIALRAPLGLSGGGMADTVTVPGQAAVPGSPGVKYTAVGQDYFRTMGIQLLRGRVFDSHDAEGSAPVVIVNETMARRFWPGEDPVGKIIRLGTEPKQTRTVVGVAANTHINSVEENPEPYFYLPFDQTRFWRAVIITAPRVDPMALVKPLRAAVAAIDRRAPVLDVTTEKLLVHARLFEQQVSATLVGALGVIGLILATVGLYGLISHFVTRRTREIGIRMALGARRRDALLMVLRQGVGLVLIGSAIGLAGVFFGAGLVKELIYGISPHDPLTYASVVVLMMLVAVLASLLPARKATRIEPIAALREE